VNETTVDAVAEVVSPALRIELPDGEQANIFATLLKQHIEGLIAGDPSKADAAVKIRGKLGLHSTEPDAKVTLVFGNEGLIIKNGFDDDLDGRITGPLKLQTETLVGAANAYTSILRRRLRLGIKWSRPMFTAQTYGFLRVPESMRPKPESAT
jgi:hypothetical protein